MGKRKGILWLALAEQSLPVHPIFSELTNHYHVTLHFNCTESQYSDLIGRRVPVMIVGNFYNDRIQALQVSLSTDPEIEAICQNPVPHITISMREGVRPVESNSMLSQQHNALVGQWQTLESVVEFSPFH